MNKCFEAYPPKYVLRVKGWYDEGYENIWSGESIDEGIRHRQTAINYWGNNAVELLLNKGGKLIK